MSKVIDLGEGYNGSKEDKAEIRLTKDASQLTDTEVREVVGFLIDRVNTLSQTMFAVKTAMESITTLAESVNVVADRYHNLQIRQEALTEMMKELARTAQASTDLMTNMATDLIAMKKLRF